MMTTYFQVQKTSFLGITILLSSFLFFPLISCTEEEDSMNASSREILKKAERLLLEGREGDALSLLEERGGKDPLLSLLTGKIYFFQGDYEKAESIFRSTLTGKHVKKKDFPAGRKWLARTLIFRGLGAEAESTIQISLQKDPEDPELLVLLGKARRLEGDMEGAIQAYTMAVQFSEYLAEAYIDLADIYRTYGLDDQMRSALLRAIALLGDEHPLADPLTSLSQNLNKEGGGKEQ